jgi:hypothetical protein
MTYAIFDESDGIKSQLKLFLDNISIKDSLMMSHRMIIQYLIDENDAIKNYQIYKQKLMHSGINKNKRSLISYYCSIPVKIDGEIKGYYKFDVNL